MKDDNWVKHLVPLLGSIGLILGVLFIAFSSQHGFTGLQVFSPSAVVLSGVSPSTVFQAATIQLNLTGSDFNSSAVVSISNPDISVLSTVIENSSLITVNISVLINATAGLYDVNVTQGSDSSALVGVLNVSEGPFNLSSLVSLSALYFSTNYTVNLTYNITTAPGVSKSQVNITGGWMNLTNLNTSNSTLLGLANATDPEGTFTFQFDEFTFAEQGYYEAEIYLDLIVDGEYIEREYYAYVQVGDIIIGGFCGDGFLGFGEACDPPGTPCIPEIGELSVDPSIDLIAGVCDPVCQCQQNCDDLEVECEEDAQFTCPEIIEVGLQQFVAPCLSPAGGAVLCCLGIGNGEIESVFPNYNFGFCNIFDVIFGSCFPAGIECESGSETTCVKITECGDGIVEGAEQCDPGGAGLCADEDCDEFCQCPAACGNGIVEPPEECDPPFSFGDCFFGFIPCGFDCTCPIIIDSVALQQEIEPFPIAKKCCPEIPVPTPTPPTVAPPKAAGGGGRPCYFEVIDITSDGKSTTIHFASKPNCPLTVSLGGRTFNIINQDVAVTVPFYPGPNVPVFVNGREIGKTPEIVPEVEAPAPVTTPVPAVPPVAAPPFMAPPKKACPETACVPLPYGMGVRDDALSAAFGVDVVPCSQIDVAVLDLLALVGDESDKALYEMVKKCCPCPVIEYPAAPCPTSQCEKTLSGELGVRDDLLSAMYGVAVVPCSVIDINAIDLLALTGDASDKALYRTVKSCCPQPCP